MEHVNGWCFRGIYKGGLWEDDLHASARPDSGYLHDGRADQNPYPHDRRSDKDSYPHDSNNQCIILRLQLSFVMIFRCSVFRRTWTVSEELFKGKSFFILFFVFLSEFVIRQVQTNIY